VGVIKKPGETRKKIWATAPNGCPKGEKVGLGEPKADEEEKGHWNGASSQKNGRAVSISYRGGRG